MFLFNAVLLCCVFVMLCFGYCNVSKVARVHVLSTRGGTLHSCKRGMRRLGVIKFRFPKAKISSEFVGKELNCCCSFGEQLE